MRGGWLGRRVVGMYWRVMNEACEYLFCGIMRNTTSTTGWADPLSISLATGYPQWGKR